MTARWWLSGGGPVLARPAAFARIPLPLMTDAGQSFSDEMAREAGSPNSAQFIESVADTVVPD